MKMKTIILDESDFKVIKQMVSQYHAEEKKLQSSHKLKTVLKGEGILDCGVKHLRTVLCQLGFKNKNYWRSEIEEECATFGYEIQHAAGDLLHEGPRKNGVDDTNG